MVNYNLYKFLKEELKNGSSDLVTRPSGQVIRGRIEREIMKEEEGETIALDFSEIGVIDYSCADEVVSKLISRLISEEYGKRYVILIGLNQNQRENIEVALERKDLAVLGRMRDGESLIVGYLNNYLRETLDLIHKKGEITSNELSEELNLPLNTSGTRLLNLYKKHLVKREDKIVEGGRIWVYRGL